jgi:hypothetical protein
MPHPRRYVILAAEDDEEVQNPLVVLAYAKDLRSRQELWQDDHRHGAVCPGIRRRDSGY